MNSIPDLKDKVLTFGWIAGLLIIIALIWILTQPVQANYLLRTVNSALIADGYEHRVVSAIPAVAGKPGILGYWYAMYNSPDRMFVFAVFKDGILVPLGARVANNGKVEEIIPLSAHAVQMLDNLPKSIIQMYITRIEIAALSVRGGRAR
jgi:hypothetical protein